jgi:hypothetical protein
MITDEQFENYINQLSDAYEDLKDHVCAAMPRTIDVMNSYEKLAKFRDIACTALREAHNSKEL